MLHPNIITKDEVDDIPINNNLLIPHMSSMANLALNYLVLGSVNGDLHCINMSAL